MSPIVPIISGAVLAGGRSRRMGTDKALLRPGGISLLERGIRTLRSVVPDVVVAGGEARRYASCGLPCLDDPLPDAGPLGGLLAALNASAAGAVLVLACDLPFVPPALMRLLISADPAIPIVMASSGDITQPLCARYATSLRPDLSMFLNEGNRRVMEFVSAHEHVYLEIGPGHPLFDPYLLSNMNTEDDIRSAESIMLHRARATGEEREPHT